jgi:lysyl-tRNA synthetase, class I
MALDRELLAASKAWPIVEAVRLLARVEESGKGPGEEVVFQTGYGPSGLPHIGTFAEVFRTSLVRHAFHRLSDRPTRLVAFSDDMDGLRKVPENIPNAELVRAHLGKPLTAIPDPFGTHASYGEHMNARLRAFLDQFGFDYSFVSATDCYRSGRFNQLLLRALERHEEIRAIVLPTLGPERRETYSPILPICPRTGRVLQVAILERDVLAGTVTYRDPDDGHLVEVPVTNGRSKLQWRADWAMRWVALGVDYEMYGKDLIDSVKVATRIAHKLGGRQPEGFFYELFLDEHGRKISKSLGNGLTVEEWLRYGIKESLALFMYRDPRKAKRLYFDVIPRNADEYVAFLDGYPEQDDAQRLSNPVWHIHSGEPPSAYVPVSFTMLLNLASVANAETPEVLWGFIRRYTPDATPGSAPLLARMVEHALAYYHDFVKPAKAFRAPDERERAALTELEAVLAGFDEHSDGEAIQYEVYEVGKRHGFENLRAWFQALYEILLGQSQGPRFGSFVALYGVEETRALIRRALAGELLSAAVR